MTFVTYFETWKVFIGANAKEVLLPKQKPAFIYFPQYSSEWQKAAERWWWWQWIKISIKQQWPEGDVVLREAGCLNALHPGSSPKGCTIYIPSVLSFSPTSLLSVEKARMNESGGLSHPSSKKFRIAYMVLPLILEKWVVAKWFLKHLCAHS